jgi:hypothetical protein
MKLVGYKINGQDNDTYMFQDNSRIPKCEKCGYRLNFSTTNPDYFLKSCKDAISTTYDGQTIVSKAFKHFCELNRYSGIKFGGFENDPNHFHLILMQVVQFDAIKRKTRFENLCSQCGNYESIIGATPTYLLVDKPLEDGFYRSDLIFASGNEKHPLNLVGIETKAKLEAAGLGLEAVDFSPAYGIE